MPFDCRKKVSALAWGLLLGVTMPASAVTVNVDFGLAGHQVEAGFVGMSVPTADTTAGPVSQNVNGVNVSVNGGGNLVRSRTRAATAHPIGDVAEDFFFGNNSLTVTLQNLPTGTYYYRSYHHDTDFTTQPNLAVALTDAVAAGKAFAAAVPVTSGTVPGVVSTVVGMIQSNGSDVILHHTSGSNTIINGFELTDTLPNNLYVDFGAKIAANQVQAGYQGFSAGTSASSTTADPLRQFFFTDLGNEGSVSVTLNNPTTNGNIGVRDRLDVNHPQGDLAEDFFFDNAGATLEVSLGRLLPGQYQITTYHHDSEVAHIPFHLSVDDAQGNGRVVNPAQAQSTGTNPAAIAKATYIVTSDGINPVVIRMNEQADDAMVINGIDVEAVGKTLRVDFARISPTNDLQNGFQAFDRFTSDTQQIVSPSETYNSDMGIAGTVTVQLTSVSNATGLAGLMGGRDRGNLVAEFGDIGEDFLFSPANHSLDMQLIDLHRGEYVLTTYHQDIGAAQGLMSILVSDALGNDRLITGGLAVAGSAGSPAVATFLIYSDGINPITVRFDANGSTEATVLNGFALSQYVIPEPATMSLLLIAGMGLLRRRARNA